jgi:preprotein translocase subunit SecE
MAEQKKTQPPRKAEAVKASGKGAAPGKSARAAAKEEPSKGLGTWVEQGVLFLREVKTELRKVTWPGRKQTISSTGVVLGLVVLLSLFLGFVDYVLSHVMRSLIS